jgi:hypothetical protein
VTTPLFQLGRNRLIVLLILLISVVPFGGAWYLAKHKELLQGGKKSNYGHLIAPAVSFGYDELGQAPLVHAENLPEMKGKWVLLQVSAGPECSQLCRETAYKTGQIRLMLNKEITRVRRLMLLPGTANAAQLQELSDSDPTLLVSGLPDSLKQRLEAAVGSPLSDGMVLLLDPFANLMMWYGPGFDPYGVQRDLQRLLKASQIG